MRQGGHVSQDRIERDTRLVLVAEVLAPRVDLFLARRIPGHIAPERKLLAPPAIRPLLHERLDLGRFRRPPLPLQVIQQRTEDVALHQPELDVPDPPIPARIPAECESSSLIRLIQIPVPWLDAYQSCLIASDSVHGPIRGDHVRALVPATDVLRPTLVPAGPTPPLNLH